MDKKPTIDVLAWMNIGQIYLIGIVSFLAYFQVNQLLALYLSPDQFAQYHLSLRTTFLLSNILILGQPLTVRTFLSRAISHGDYAKGHAVLRWVLKKVGQISLLIAGLFALMTLLYWHFPQSLIIRFLLQHKAIFLLVNLPIMLLVSLLPAILDVFHCFKFSRVTQSILSYFLYFLAIFFQVLMGWALTDTSLICSFTLSQILVLFIVLFKLRKPLLTIFSAPVDRQHLSNDQFSVVAKQGFVANMTYQMMIHASVLSIGFLSNEENIVANYSTIMIIVGLFFTLSEFLRGYLSQRIMELVDQKKSCSARQLFKEVTILNGVGTLIFLMIGWVWSTQILELFGSEFSVNDELLQYGLIINAGLNLLAPVWSLVEYAYPYDNAKYCVIQLLLNCLLLLLLVPFIGISGALTGDVIAELIVLALLFRKVWSKYGFFQYKTHIDLAHLSYND